ncbi:MAG TPA: YggT family protein [Xanthomonadales bacterium]|nr:YggT family protein [Xanthomonadales bacterium]
MGLILFQAFFGLLLFVAVLRVVLPLSGARFRNPICQLVYKVTNPVLVPLTRAIPNFRGVSIAGILLAWLIALLGIGLLVAISASKAGPGMVLLLSVGVVVHFVLAMYFWAIVIRAVMSFFSPDMGNPAVEVLHDLTDPVLKPFQRLPPRNLGIDLSPLYACVAIRIVQYTLSYAGLPSVL